MAFDERLSCAGEVLLFGPQALSFEESTFGNLRAAIVDEVDNQWMRRAVFELPAWLERFGAKLPQLAVAEGQRSLEDLHRWLETGALPPTAKKLPNLLLTPLVVCCRLTRCLLVMPAYGNLKCTGPDTTHTILEIPSVRLPICPVWGPLRSAWRRGPHARFLHRAVECIGGVVYLKRYRLRALRLRGY